MTPPARDVLALRNRLSARLRPLALAIGVLVSLGLPITFFALQYDALHREAHASAARLAARLPGADTAAVVREFASAPDVVSVRVLDRRPQSVPTMVVLNPQAEHWWNRHVPVGSAPIVVAAESIGTVEVALAQGRLLVITLGLLVMSTLTGVVLGILVYAVPVRVVGGMESHVAALVSEQDSLIAAGRVLTGSLDLRDVLDHLTNAARSLPGIDVVRIWLCDPLTGVQSLATQAGHERTDLEPTRTLGPNEGISGAVIMTRRPIVVIDALDDPRLVNGAWFKDERVASCLGVPLLVGDTVLGTLFCMSRTRRGWSPSEVALAETLGSVAAVAIRNATNFGGMTQRGQRLRGAADLARAVSSQLELTAVLREVVGAVTALRHPLFCVVRLVDLVAGGYRVAGTGGAYEEAVFPLLRFGEGLTHAAAQSGRPLLVLDVATDRRAMGLPPHYLKDFPIYFGVPIQSGDVLLGVLSVSFPAGAPPTADEREAIELYAGQAAVAITNARLYAEATRREREAEELARIARVLSETLDVTDVGERIG